MYFLTQKKNENEVVVLAAQVFAKLSLFQRVCDVKIIQRLLLMYFDPATETIVEVRQCLSVFFQAFVSSLLNSELVAKNADLLRQALIPSLREADQAPRKSTLTKVPTSQMCQFVISLLDVRLPTQPIQIEKSSQSFESKHDSPASPLTTDLDNNASAELICTPHEKLALDCCMYILYKPAGSLCKTLSQALSLLTLSSENQDFIRKLRAVLAKILTEVTDKNAIRYLKKVQKACEVLDANKTDPCNDVDKLFEDWCLHWENTFGPLKQANIPKVKRVPKKKQTTFDCSSDSETDGQTDESELEGEKTRTKPKQANKPKAKGVPKKKKRDTWDSDCSSDSETDKFELESKTDGQTDKFELEGEKTRTKVGRKRATVSYREASSADESSEDESSSFEPLE